MGAVPNEGEGADGGLSPTLLGEALAEVDLVEVFFLVAADALHFATTSKVRRGRRETILFVSIDTVTTLRMRSTT